MSTLDREAIELFLQEASENLQYLREYVSVLQDVEPRREDLEALLSVGGCERLVALRLKLGGEALGERGVVVHDEKERSGPRHGVATLVGLWRRYSSIGPKVMAWAGRSPEGERKRL